MYSLHECSGGDRCKAIPFVGLARRNAHAGARAKDLDYVYHGDYEQRPQLLPSTLAWR